MNNLTEIKRQCEMLMTAHGVGSLKFEFDNHKKRIGACHNITTAQGVVVPTKITVSRHFASILTMDEIRETMLHEIAHALTPGDKHGRKWRAKARELGIKPSTKKKTTASPQTPWKGYCKACGIQRGAQHRAPLRVYLCGSEDCKKLPYVDRMLQWHKNGTPVVAQDMPERFYDEFQRIHNMARIGGLDTSK